MRLVLVIVTAMISLAACGQATAPPAASFAPAPTTSAPTPTVQSTHATEALPGPTRSATAAQRAAFVRRLRAINPSLVSGDIDDRVGEGLSLCASITGNDPPQEVIVNAAIAFNVALGDAAKIATAVRDTLCH